MTTDLDADAVAERRRAARRRRLQQRQTLIFGVLLTALLAVALLAAAMWGNVIPSPFSRPFSSEAPTDAANTSVPCPPANALPTPFGEITVNIFNATTEGGLAARTASGLAQFGITVSQTANYSTSVDGVARIVTGPHGLRSAYTVAALMPGAEVALDGREDETIDVVVGSAFDSVPDPTSAALDPEAPLEVPAGCSPVTIPEPTDDATDA
ncbi:LytR C-terminal domain-containing protein [Georgenia sunbinii]|uniref:LytR C-terminal domain-containing protein n=1 Tax=Georgenia sunbinii TaxID=3117728 RepID=UPI002F25FFA8